MVQESRLAKSPKMQSALETTHQRFNRRQQFRAGLSIERDNNVNRRPRPKLIRGLLIHKNRVTVLKDFFRAFQEVFDTAEGIVRIEVQSASAMEASDLDSLRSRIAEAVNIRPVVLDVHWKAVRFRQVSTIELSEAKSVSGAVEL